MFLIFMAHLHTCSCNQEGDLQHPWVTFLSPCLRAPGHRVALRVERAFSALISMVLNPLDPQRAGRHTGQVQNEAGRRADVQRLVSLRVTKLDSLLIEKKHRRAGRYARFCTVLISFWKCLQTFYVILIIGTHSKVLRSYFLLPCSISL